MMPIGPTSSPVQPSADPCSLGYPRIARYQVLEPVSLTFSNRVSVSFVLLLDHVPATTEALITLKFFVFTSESPTRLCDP